MVNKKGVKGSLDVELTFKAVDKFEKEERRRQFLKSLKESKNINTNENENKEEKQNENISRP